MFSCFSFTFAVDFCFFLSKTCRDACLARKSFRNDINMQQIYQEIRKMLAK